MQHLWLESRSERIIMIPPFLPSLKTYASRRSSKRSPPPRHLLDFRVAMKQHYKERVHSLECNFSTINAVDIHRMLLIKALFD